MSSALRISIVMRRQCRKLAFAAVCFISFLFCETIRTLKPDQYWNNISEYGISKEFKELIDEDVLTKVSQLQCHVFFQEDSSQKRDYIKHYIRKRIELHNLPKSTNVNVCASIRSRWKFTTEARSQEERDFPIAFARTVFTDYALLEEMLSVEYQPQNAYCYALDSKAEPHFKQRIRQLAECFPNVVVPEIEFSVFSNGKNVTNSHISCLNALRHVELNTPWKYAVLLQNHDIPLKTNREMVQILKIFNGTNDISTLYTLPASVNANLNWTFANLQLYRDEKRNKKMLYKDDGKTLREIRHTKSLVLVELSRNAVDFLLDEVDVNRFVSALESSSYGMDEVVLSTLNSNLPDMPGSFTSHCLYEEKRTINGVGRYTVWKGNVNQCKSNKFRHFSCIFGVEDLKHLASNKLTQLYLNKFMAVFDYGAIHCWLKHIKTRILSGSFNVNTHYYKNLPHVRYNQLKMSNGGIAPRPNQFECR